MVMMIKHCGCQELIVYFLLLHKAMIPFQTTLSLFQKVGIFSSQCLYRQKAGGQRARGIIRAIPAGTIRWNNVEIKIGTTSRPNFNYITTLFQRQMPAGMGSYSARSVHMPTVSTLSSNLNARSLAAHPLCL